MSFNSSFSADPYKFPTSNARPMRSRVDHVCCLSCAVSGRLRDIRHSFGTPHTCRLFGRLCTCPLHVSLGVPFALTRFVFGLTSHQTRVSLALVSALVSKARAASTLLCLSSTPRLAAAGRDFSERPPRARAESTGTLTFVGGDHSIRRFSVIFSVDRPLVLRDSGSNSVVGEISSCGLSTATVCG